MVFVDLSITEDTHIFSYKESGRQNMSASTLMAALRVNFKGKSNIVENSCFAFSGQSVGRILNAVKSSERIRGSEFYLIITNL